MDERREMLSVRQEIDGNARIRDDIPEMIPTTLARELVNHYPAEVKEQRDRLSSLAAQIIRRERASANEERASRRRETTRLLDRIRGLELELAKAKRHGSELAEAAADALALRERMKTIVDRMKRFGRSPRASKKNLVGQVVAMATWPENATRFP